MTESKIRSSIGKLYDIKRARNIELEIELDELKNESKTESKNEPKHTILTYMPKEIHNKILLEMDPADLINACTTNKEALNICSTDNFWKQYYDMRKLKFKPWKYEYTTRIRDAQSMLFLNMDIDTLQSTCKQDKLEICQTNDFWESYFAKNHVRLHDFKYYKLKNSIRNRVKEFKIAKLLESFDNVPGKLYADITDGEELYDILNESYVNVNAITDLNKGLLSKIILNKMIKISIDVNQPDSFIFVVYNDTVANGVKFVADWIYLFHIYDLMSNIHYGNRYRKK